MITPVRIFAKTLLLFTISCFTIDGLFASGQSREGLLGDQVQTDALNALFVDDAITLDGILDDEAWKKAAAITDFRQSDPIDGAPATQRSEVRVLYGANSLYVGAILLDDEPEAIERVLGRRDDFNRADWFVVSIDAYFDRRTAYSFGVNAAGVQFDAILSGARGRGPGGGGGSNAPNDMDPSWDAIWYSDVRMTELGWSVELRIPYSMLRFADVPAQTWGIHFMRTIPRLGEESEWPHVPRTQRGNLVAQFGRLEGIQNVKPRRNIQVSPYTVSRLETRESEENPGRSSGTGRFDAGGDLKIGFGPNVTLDATINPDFGQVEADPAELNLTAFETFFQERRPFFVEGTNIYQFAAGPGQLLYTRRIGADAPIIGATKLSGRTNSGLSFGVLAAATGARFNPSEGFGVVRASQQIGSYSSAGGILTLFDASNVAGVDHLQSLAAGADWDLRMLDNRYGVEGFFAVTNRNLKTSSTDTETGFAGKIWARKRQGDWTGFAGFDVFSDTFNPNDVGQLRENNFLALISNVEHNLSGGQPFGPFSRANAEFSFIQQFSYDEGLDLGQEIEVQTRWTFRGFQGFNIGVELENLSAGYDIFETRGLLPWARPTSFSTEAEFETDTRRNWVVEPGIEGRFFDDGGREVEVAFEGTWNAGARLSLSGELRGGWETDVTAWSANETFQRTGGGWQIGRETAPPADLSPNDFVPIDNTPLLDALFAGVDPVSAGTYYVSVFGARDTRSADFTLRSTVTLTPKLSLQVYSQLFAARGRYDRFQIQQDRDRLAAYDAYPKRDEFAFSSLQSNVVLRWEYRPGSSLFLVWTHGRSAEDMLNPLAPWNRSPYDRSLNDQFNTTFDIFPENVFLIKLNYTFLY
ncbi:MAG: DUF5916 domain-containing protein [Rhodothermales bacterium]|nr:DUF5916 domain-containing protein [Rhodothermales bacterium]